mmetsp:Transcript_7508/g.15162  ORF Transcript_7508/g.15162 Transcript_7508/m.15162 type:complete len:83 (-) Transcript_7508:303-551(-)
MIKPNKRGYRHSGVLQLRRKSSIDFVVLVVVVVVVMDVGFVSVGFKPIPVFASDGGGDGFSGAPPFDATGAGGGGGESVGVS